MVHRFLYSCYLKDKSRYRAFTERLTYTIERWRYNSMESIQTRNKMLLSEYVTKEDIIEGKGLNENQEYEWSVILKPEKKEKGLRQSFVDSMDRFFK